MLKAIRSTRELGAAEKEGEVAPAVKAPRSRFNGEVSPHRSVTTADFPLEAFKHLRHAVPGATINDLAISVFGGALRKYLDAHGDALEESLVVQIPVNIRDDSGQGEDGNEITPINASSGSAIADPLERLIHVAESTANAKVRLGYMGESSTRELADAMGPHITKALFTAMENAPRIQALATLMPGGPNFALSNMPGPPVPMYLCGAELTWGIGLGPMMPNMGLFATFTSGLGRMTYGVSACRTMLPDPDFFRQCLLDTYAETARALGRLADANDPGRARPRKTRRGRRG